MIGFLKTHPFWTLLIVLVVVSLIQLPFLFGSGSGGLDVGRITPDSVVGSGGLEEGPTTTEPGP